MFYNSFTERQLNDLFLLLRKTWEKQAYAISEERDEIWAITAKDFYGDIVYRYEFWTNNEGFWTMLRCSGNRSANERQAMEQSHLCFGSCISKITDDPQNSKAYIVYLGSAISVRALEKEGAMAVCRAMLELITYDKKGENVVTDDSSVKIVMKHFFPQMSAIDDLAFVVLLRKSMDISIDDAFSIIRNFSEMTKKEFKTMVYDVVREVRTEHREVYASEMLKQCKIN